MHEAEPLQDRGEEEVEVLPAPEGERRENRVLRPLAEGEEDRAVACAGEDRDEDVRDEAPEAAVAREVGEELGCSDAALRPSPERSAR